MRDKKKCPTFLISSVDVGATPQQQLDGVERLNPACRTQTADLRVAHRIVADGFHVSPAGD